MKKAHKQKKRTASKSKPTKAKLNLRFLPALVITLLASFLWAQPSFTLTNTADDDVLGIATNISHSGLLSSTNTQRSAHGAGNLSLNSKLNSAAQAKASDMVNRNYWSHQTPDGLQPWVFITNTGYQYLSAGENLAFGFNDSASTVTGWMNSPSHKANLINKVYTEVGFGVANSNNFVSEGPQTVVVAMYANPQPAAAPVPAPVDATSRQQVQSSENQRKLENKPVPTEVSEEPDAAPIEEEPKKENEKDVDTVVTYVDANGLDDVASTKQITRASLLTGKTWSATLVVALVCMSGLLWGIHRGYRLNQVIKNGRELIGRNIHLDLVILSLIFLAYILLSTSGYIK